MRSHPARIGGLRHDSWVAAVDQKYGDKINMFWADPQQIFQQIGRLTATELAAVKLTASAQMLEYNAQRGNR